MKLPLIFSFCTNLESKADGLLAVPARTNGERAMNACDADDQKRKAVQTILVACLEAGEEAHLVTSSSHKTQMPFPRS
jgi:hypothetical protein